MHSYVAIHRDALGQQRELSTHGDVLQALDQRAGVTWIHLHRITPEDARMMEEDFGLHPLAVEDCLNQEYQRPKVEEYDRYTFVVVHGIDYEATAESVTTAELNIFVGENAVITSALVDMPAIDHLREEARRGRELLPETPSLLAYTLIDAIVDNTFPIIERMDDVTDLIEQEVLQNAHPALLAHLVNLKRSIMRLSRVTGPQGLLLGQLANGIHPRFRGTEMLFRDIHDHQLWVSEQILDLRDRADHAVDTYHSVLSLKQNETMRVLSVVASIFLPLTLLAGIYGMNFQHMPELQWRYGYFVVLAVMLVVVSAGTYLLFGRALLGWGRDRIGHLVSFALEPPAVSEAVREAARLRSRVMRARDGDGTPDR